MSIASVSGKTLDSLTRAEQKRVASGKACAFEPHEVFYMLRIRELYSKRHVDERSIIYLPMDEKSLQEMNRNSTIAAITKNTVIEIWKKVNKARPDSPFTQTNKKYNDPTVLDSLPLSKPKYDVILKFLDGTDRLVKRGAEHDIQSVSFKHHSTTLPKLVAREVADLCEKAYPMLDQLISCIPDEEISGTDSKKGSKRGWNLWTTNQEETDAALLKVKSKFVANLIVACITPNNIIASVAHSPPSTDVYVVMQITKTDLESLETFKSQMVKAQQLLAVRFKEATQ